MATPSPIAPGDVEARWPHMDIHYLVYEGDHFMVCLDNDLFVDWATDDDYPDFRDPKKFNQIISRAAAIECTPNKQHCEEVREAFKRMVGEGIARALDHDYESAALVLDRALAYITDRNVEDARYYQLLTACVLGVFLFIAGAIFWLLREPAIRHLTELAYFVFMSAGAGGLGAVLSMIFRLGNSFPTCEAPIKLHVLEATGRVLAGSLCGLIVSGAVIMGLILANFADLNHLHATLLAAAMASGTSERWAPSLITQLSGDSNPKTRNKGGLR